MPPARETRARWVPIALGASVVVGAALRLRHLGSTRLNYDESFTAMVGRLPIGDVFGFLRANDSHPPLDYLLQLPLARLGASPLVFRFPATLCSIAALALFAWWMRDRGRGGVFATIAMAICAFQVLYAREARMYGPMELIGVGVAVLADSWLRAPRRSHAVVVGVLTFIGLMTHVSMALAAVGLLVLAGVRRDRDAWRWRAGVAAGVAAWALLWGSSFLVQSRGGHSSWIPHTTPIRFVDTVSALVTSRPGVSALVVAAIVAGGFACRRYDRSLAWVLVCCSAIPVALAGLIGLHAPVLLARTLTVASWGPLLALGYLIDAITRKARYVGVAVAAVAAIAMLSSVPAALYQPGPTAALAQLEHVARPGDVLAIEPPSKGVELDWTIGVRSDDGPARTIQLPGLHHAVVLALTGRRPTGRMWLMQMTSTLRDPRHAHACARTWHRGPLRMVCLRLRFAKGFPSGSKPTITTLFGRRRV